MDQAYHEYDKNAWVCLDDGTGKNLYYQNTVTNVLSRICPDNFLPGTFENGLRRYYFRGNCIRCRKKEFPSVLSMKKEQIIYSLNICSTCIIDTTPNIDKLCGNGDKIWKIHGTTTPKNLYVDLSKAIVDKKREEELTDRAKFARYEIQLDSKQHRDLERWSAIKEIAHQYGIVSGKYLSWGLGHRYDEYYGDVNNENVPHGKGIKIYSDKSIYAGDWKDGCKHTNKKAVWIRPDGYDYEGQWFSDLKHGFGEVKYPNGTTYKGEFARDLEHGNGHMEYIDGSRFEGRFRYGKRDGPGVMTSTDGSVTRLIFRDYIVYYNEKPLPKISNTGDDTNPDITQFQPSSLFHIANQSLSLVIRHSKMKISPEWMRERIPEHLKSIFAIYYLSSSHPPPSQLFIKSISDTAFKYSQEVSISSVKLRVPEMDTFVFFQCSNNKLEILRLPATGIDAASVGIICHNISHDVWPCLHTLDLSFNQFDVSSVRSIVQAASDLQSITTLKLSGCKILANGAFVIANIIESDDHITSLDLSFNSIKGPGAESLAEALIQNTTLTSLNIRKNDIGVVGGNAFAEVFKINQSLKILCIIDNQIGTEKMALISGRMSGNIKDVVESVRSSEVQYFRGS